MQSSLIHYFAEDTNFAWSRQPQLTAWVKQVVASEGFQLISLNFIACSDAYLHEKNVQYLQHDTLTDVITFDYAEADDRIEGEVYLSIDRIKDNAQHYAKDWTTELHTVMIHGVLHLLGYQDKTPLEQQIMREKEAECCQLLEDFSTE